MKDWSVDEWEGCYPSKWKGMIVPDAITHPAKFSSRLIRRIYEHMLQEGWLKAGDMVVDPFGGVALGALDAMRLGLRWRGMELEARFAELGNQNIGFWNAKFSRMPGWCQDATLFQGDSRHLIEVLNGGDATDASPPFRDQFASHDNFIAPHDTTRLMNTGRNAYGDASGAVASPPYSEARIGQESGQEHCGRGDQYGGGATPGQLGAMKADDFSAAISSPPYAEMPVEKNSGSVDRQKQWETYRASGGGQSFEAFCKTYEAVQIASIPGSGTDIELRKKLRASGEWEGYNRDNKDNLGSNAGDDFWMAARQIVEQVYMVLRPGGHAVWVVKGFVKNKQLVDFPGQWRQLCEAVGFTMVHEHHAMLVHDKGTSHTLEGGTVHHQTESKSFFRRLAESKGSPRIDYETILCMVKGEA